MSRPTTRGKNKRHKPEDDNVLKSEILRNIHMTGDVTQNDIHQLYMMRKPVCQGCRINSKDNPNCFCGLIPPPNGTRKSGLWQKMSDIILALGPDPCEDLRESVDSPAGLTNLGATCYANSILQCLYMNTSFRLGVFCVEPDLLDRHPVLDQLARLFVQLHSSIRAYIDSAPFIKTLELDNGVQQDSHEFLTLLLSLLERSLSHSKVPKARTIVQDLFRGSVSHVTRYFHGCKDGPGKVYLQIVFMITKLVTETTMKKKLTSTFSFPGELDMGQRLCKPFQLKELMFDLSAVLIHKGTAVNSGHYVAHIKDERTGLWWEFDDEQVTKLGSHPFGEGSSTSKTNPLQIESVAESMLSEQTNNASNMNHASNGRQSSSDSKSIHHVETFSSADAYMLMYTRRHLKKYTKNPCSDMDNSGVLVSDDSSEALPFHLLEEVQEINASYIKACEDYKLKREKESNHITERRQEVRSILSEAPVRSLEEPFFWIATDWLRQWADNVTPLAIDNTSIQCSHEKVPASKGGLLKRLSPAAWTTLHSKVNALVRYPLGQLLDSVGINKSCLYDGGPTLTDSDFCRKCLMDGANNAVRADDYRYQRKAMRDIAEAAHAGKNFDSPLYFVSKAWLSQWLRRKNVDFPCESDIGPTASIRCPHGQLTPEQASGAKRVLVPENLWLFLVESANIVKPDDPVGCSCFPSDSEICAICSIELTEVACSEDRLRETKLKQRQNHERLFQGKNIALSPGCNYYLLPSSWLAKWRSYITVCGKNMSSSAEPESLESVIDSLKCNDHSRLLERAPDLFWKRGSILQRASPTDGLTLITESDWKFFCQEWDGTEWDGISAQIEFRNCGTKKVIGSCEEMQISEVDLSPSNDELNNELESREPFIKTDREVCEDCVGEKETHHLLQKLQYCNEEICVHLVRGKEAPKSIVEASGAISEPDRRVSKRSRKTSNGNSINLTVSGSTSIYQLKLMIWEYFGVVKENQILHKGNREIEDESATLADLNIFPGDVLWVKDSEIHENRDIADELSEQKMEVQPAEEGFRGTLLSSNVSTQVI
ncbi:hypothetical protein IFM89_011582 [Coptis chinensis]|uniref:ubiquitinyl hydrolase 1 n=1 Tax=Coptis chinensis TaxID=261450 RepID=A0A835LHJ9_9MAGN|nr:hypothetical protein IFM89_011582 [Coptis chinensis]